MVFDYFTVKEISKFSNINLTGAIIKDIFSQDKDKIVFTFQKKDSSKLSMEFSCLTEFPYIQIKGEFKRSKKNSISLIPEIVEQTVEGVYLYNNDRVISINLSDQSAILVSMIPSRYNALLIKGDRIINSFKNSNILIDSEINNFFRTKKTELKKEVKTYKDYLRHNNPIINNYYITEICLRSNKNENEAIAEDNLRIIDCEVEKIYKELENPKYLKYSNNENSIHSLLELKSNLFKKEEFDSIISLINSLISENLYNISLSKKKDEILSKHRQKLNLLEKKISSIGTNIEHNTQSSRYKEYGDAIFSNLFKIKKGESELHYNSDKENMIIKIKKELTPQQNAEYYYKKYKKQKNSIEELKKKKEVLSKEYIKRKKEYSEIIENTNLKIIKAMHKEQLNSNEETEKKHFRKFILNENFQVWVGKDSYSNDLLTMRYSSPNDLWFHVRGATGSHTVLKINNKTTIPDKEIIKVAASIAAYYSKARNVSNVPVAYCERKYVKKTKGLKQGSVIMEKEKVLNIKPGIPNPEDDK